MTSQKLIDDFVIWAREVIAPQFQFKVPPPADEEETGNYDHTLANPEVHAMYFPSVEDNSMAAPVILVQTYDGKLDLSTGKGSIIVRLVFQVWNPGIHDGENLTPGTDGWRDLDSIIETTIVELGKARIIRGHAIHPDSIEYSPLKQDGAIVDLYPFFSGYVTFTVDLHKIIKPDFINI